MWVKRCRYRLQERLILSSGEIEVCREQRGEEAKKWEEKAERKERLGWLIFIVLTAQRLRSQFGF